MGWFDDNGFADPGGGVIGVPTPAEDAQWRARYGPSGYAGTPPPGFIPPTSSAGPAGMASYDFNANTYGGGVAGGQPSGPLGYASPETIARLNAMSPQERAQSGAAGTDYFNQIMWAGEPKSSAGPAGQAPMGGGGNPQAQALWQQAGQDPGKFIELWRTANNLQPNQADPASINSIVSALRSVGVNAESAGTDGNGHTDGIHINGQGFKLVDGSNRWLPGLQSYGQAEGSGGGGYGSPGALADFNAPAPFTPPSYADFMNYPGLQAGLDFGRQAIERGASAKGTLLTTGTGKALEKFGQDYASTKYGDVFGQALATNQNRFGQALQSNEQNYKNWYNLAALGRPQ